MPILTFPNVVPDKFDFGIQFSTQVNVSSLSGSVQTVELPAARWVASLEFTNLDYNEFKQLKVFLLQSRGASGRFYLPDFAYPGISGSLSGTVTVSGAGQTGNSIIVSGASNGSTILAGDYFVVPSTNELKLVTQDVTLTGTNDTIVFEPPIRVSPTNGEALSFTNPTTIMMLQSDSIKWSNNNPAVLTDLSFSCIEAY